MSLATNPLRFGAFEVDLRAGELRKNGVKIKLQEQPLQVLGMLLECPGEVVTREELQRKLWSTDTRSTGMRDGGCSTRLQWDARACGIC